MGMLYHPKYKRADGTSVECATWWCKVYVNGQAVRMNTHQRKERLARDFMRSKEVDGKRGLPVLPKVNRATVADLVADVVADYRAHNRRSIGDTERRIRLHVLPALGHYNAAALTDADVRAYQQRRLKAGAQPATVNNELAILRRGYNLNKKTVTVRPTIEDLTTHNARKGFFEEAEFAAVRAALPPALQPLLDVAKITGWRTQSELLPLTWKQVDFTARELRLEPNTTKNGEGRTFPFTVELEAVLRAQRAHTDDIERERGRICPHVFHRDGEPIRDWRYNWTKALLAAGLATTDPETGKVERARVVHDFRRTAIRNLVRAGISEGVAMRMCGHETREVFDRYNIVSGDDLRAAAAKLDAVNSVTGKVSGKVAHFSGRQRSSKSR
jgi:integrase